MKLRNEKLTDEGKWLMMLGFAYVCLAFGIFMASGCPQRIAEVMR